MKHAIILLSFYVLVSHSLDAQNRPNIDSLKKAVELMPDDSLKVIQFTILFEKLLHKDPELAKTYAIRENQLSKKINFPRGIASSNLHFGNYYYNQSVLDSAKFFYKKALTVFYNNQDTIGIFFGKMKETGGTHWNTPNVDATNESGFTVLGAGVRNSSAQFASMGDYGYFWSTNQDPNNSLWAFRHYVGKYDGIFYTTTIDKNVGFSVRCIKN